MSDTLAPAPVSTGDPVAPKVPPPPPSEMPPATAAAFSPPTSPTKGDPPSQNDDGGAVTGAAVTGACIPETLIYYAVRRGRGVQSAVFSRWADAAPHVADFDDAEYASFDDVDEAVLFSLFGAEGVAAAAAAAKKGGRFGRKRGWEDEVNEDDGEEEENPRWSSPRRTSKAAAGVKRERSPMSEDEHEDSDGGEATDVVVTIKGRRKSGRAAAAPTPTPKKRPKSQDGGTGIGKGRGGGRPRKGQTGPSAQWVAMYDRLRVIYDSTGTTAIDAADEDNADVRRWLNTNRYTIRRDLKKLAGSEQEGLGQDPPVTLMEKVRRLEELGVVLRDGEGAPAESYPSARWSAMLAKLKAHQAETGTFEISPEDEAKADLRKWFTRLESDIKKTRLSNGDFVDRKSGAPSPAMAEKARRLAELGYVLPEGGEGDPENRGKGKRGRKPTTANCQEWREMYDRLAAYKERTGSVHIDYKDEENASMRRWWYGQQAVIRGEINKLEEEVGGLKEGETVILPPVLEEKTRLLELLDPNVRGGSRGIHHPSRFEEMLGRYLRYKDENMGNDVPSQTTDPQISELVRWAKRQRDEYVKLRDGKESKLTARNLTRLNDAGFSFKPKNKPRVSFEERLEQLKAFKAQHGHLNVPSRHPVCGEFVRQKRKEYNKFMAGKETNSLIETQMRDLVELGFVFHTGKRWTPPPEPNKSWEERFEELLNYRAAHGHCLVPKSYPGLGQWVKQQRSHYTNLKKGKPSRLTPDRVVRMTDAGFIWDATARRGESY